MVEVTMALPGKTEELAGIHTGFPRRTWQIKSPNSQLQVKEMWLAVKLKACAVVLVAALHLRAFLRI